MRHEGKQGWRAPAWGLAAAGVLTGLAFGPIGLLAGGALGGGLDYWRARHRKKWAEAHPLDENQLRAVRPLAPQHSDEVFQHAATRARPSGYALALHEFFERFAQHRHKRKFWDHDKTLDAVTGFQQSFNRDHGMRRAFGHLREDGAFDRRTAAALSLATHKPVSPDPEAG